MYKHGYDNNYLSGVMGRLAVTNMKMHGIQQITVQEIVQSGLLVEAMRDRTYLMPQTYFQRGCRPSRSGGEH